MNDKKIGIIGAGLTGLSAAFQLQIYGAEVSLFEKRSDPGGSIKSVKNNDWLVEYGPNSILLKDVTVLNFLKDLDLGDKLIEADPDAAKRYILKNGTLTATPSGLGNAFTTSLFSISSKLRVLGEPFVSKSNNPDETVAGFVQRRIGKEILDYAINPLVAGIFAGNPEKLSMRYAFPQMYEMEQEYGSLIAGSLAGFRKRKNIGRIKRRLISFPDGIQSLPRKIANSLTNTHFNHLVKAISRNRDQWFIHTTLGKYGPFDEIILNVPAYKMKEIIMPSESVNMGFFEEIAYPPVSIAALGFNKSNVEHPLDGFGFLVPELENRDILGTLFNSSLFPGRAPSGHVLLTTFVGGMRQPELAQLESELLFSLVQDELSDILGVKGDPVFREHIFWPQAIPQYHPGYDTILEKINDLENKLPGIHFAGNFRGGISVPDCIKNGLKLADTVSG
ncbi:MAG: protoporphyrinogen oxidase [Balneolaceae bacterium]